jgi:acetolactate synthase I/II/III large subunit
MKNDINSRSRRGFLKGAALAGASGAAAAIAPTPAQSTLASAPARAVGRPNSRMVAAETANPADAPQSKSTHAPGADFIADVIKSLKFDYILANPAASFRALHESLINYGNNKQPELLTCMHEESAVGMAHGYFKITGRPLPVLVHGTVGLQHASIPIYNAWCDRVPAIVIAGNHLDASQRPPGVTTIHSAQDPNSIVRDFTKWDDQPVSLDHVAESMVRAYRIAMTPPHEPVIISLDAGLQEQPQPDNAKFRIPRYVPSAPPQADASSLREAAKLLAQASNPVIVADRAARTPAGMQLVTALAEALQAPVFDQRGRMNIANSHHLNQSGRGKALIAEADVVLGLEVSDFWGTVNSYIDNGENHGHGAQEMRAKPSAHLLSISSSELLTKSNYQDFQRFQSVDIGMVGDAEASLPTLIEFIKAAIPTSQKDEIARRGERMKKSWADARARAIEATGFAWNASPISTARLSAEIWSVIKDEDWSLVSFDYFQSFWPTRLWAMDKYHNYIGHSGGYGVGYGAPAAVGAALANKSLGRISVNIQPDGDLMCAPGVLWTAAHHKIPLLSVMHNNRGYHQEVMHVQRMSNRHDRVANLGGGIAPIGTGIDSPNIDYAKLAASMGVWSAGPITNPSELQPALKRALDVVKRGEPALVDVVCQPR